MRQQANKIAVPPDVSAEIADIGPSMIDYAVQKFAPADFWVIPNAYYLYYATAGIEHALTARVWCRQPTQRERVALRQAFDIPPLVDETFGYDRGGGSMTFTWREADVEPEPQYEQVTFFTASLSSDYYTS